MLFRSDQYQSKVLKDLNGKIIPLSNETAEKLFPILQQAAEVSARQDKYASEKLFALFGYTVFLMGQANADKAFEPVKARTEKVSPLALKIIDYLSRNFTQDVSLETLSETFFISKAGLCTCFKKAMNCTIGEYVITLKINEAKRYLSATKKGMEEIAALCGFSSAAYMGLIFKSKVGLSPLQYRKLQVSKT